MNYPHFCSNFGIMWFLGQLLFYWMNLSWEPAVCHDLQNQTRHTFSSVSCSLQRHYFTNRVPSSQRYGFPVVMYGCEVDYKESWALKNWCFWTVVLEKTLESPLDCKEIPPVHPKGNQFWILFGRTDAENEAPILWPPDGKKWLIWKDPDAGKDLKWEEKGTAED